MVTLLVVSHGARRAGVVLRAHTNHSAWQGRAVKGKSRPALARPAAARRGHGGWTRPLTEQARRTCHGKRLPARAGGHHKVVGLAAGAPKSQPLATGPSGQPGRFSFDKDRKRDVWGKKVSSR